MLFMDICKKFMPLSFLHNCLLLVLVVLVSCSTVRTKSTLNKNDVIKLAYVNQLEILFTNSFNGTMVGGLSGIDYNPVANEYYLISDDRSAINPARFYTTQITLTNGKLDSVTFSSVTNLLQKNGSTYPSSKQNPAQTPDPEGIRFNPNTNQLIWTSEGERIVSSTTTLLINPAITIIDRSGKFIDTLVLPPQLQMSAAGYGPRQNGVLEGVTFSNDFKSLFVSMEEPLYQDGPRAGLTDSNAWIRIIQYDMATQKPIAQFAYKLDAVAYTPTPANAFSVNGVPEILYLSPNKLLVIERSFSFGRLPCTIKVFIADLSTAENIAQNQSLLALPPVKTVAKKVLLNMDELGIYTDNIEGVTFGPTLPNGHRSLIFVSDNNFAKLQKTQLLLFEILP